MNTLPKKCLNFLQKAFFSIWNSESNWSLTSLLFIPCFTISDLPGWPTGFAM